MSEQSPAIPREPAALWVTHLPARDIPVPSFISPLAQAMIAAPAMPRQQLPALDDLEGWRGYVARMDQFMLDMVQGRPSAVTADVEDTPVGEARVFVITPRASGPNDRFVYLDIHGGALILGGGEVCKAFGLHCAARLNVKVWAVDYRMPPDHPYPAALDDCLGAYPALLEHYAPENVIVGGTARHA